MVETATKAKEQDVPAPGAREPDHAVTRRLSDIAPERVEWLWHHRIARGKLTLGEGDPGLGKSLVALDLAANVTTGAPFPGNLCFGPANVVFMIAEDGLADTVRPRFDAAGGDPSRVDVLTFVMRSGKKAFPTIFRDIALIEDVARSREAVLLIIDPISAFLGVKDAHRDADVREALGPLSEMTERLKLAVFGIRHLNKTQIAQSLYRGGGSIGLIAAARSGFLIAPDPDDKDRRVFAPTKANLCPKPAALAYKIITHENGAPRVRWDPRPVELSADDLLRAGLEDRPAGGRATKEAASFLRETLSKGDRPSEDLREEAEARGFCWKTVQRAQKQAGAIAEKEAGPAGGWRWRLIEGGKKDNSPEPVPVLLVPLTKKDNKDKKDKTPKEGQEGQPWEGDQGEEV